jgi:hypothetical protein
MVGRILDYVRHGVMCEGDIFYWYHVVKLKWVLFKALRGWGVPVHKAMVHLSDDGEMRVFNIPRFWGTLKWYKENPRWTKRS